MWKFPTKNHGFVERECLVWTGDGYSSGSDWLTALGWSVSPSSIVRVGTRGAHSYDRNTAEVGGTTAIDDTYSIFMHLPSLSSFMFVSTRITLGVFELFIYPITAFFFTTVEFSQKIRKACLLIPGATSDVVREFPKQKSQMFVLHGHLMRTPRNILRNHVAGQSAWSFLSIRIYRNLSESIRIYQNLSKSIKIYLNA